MRQLSAIATGYTQVEAELNMMSHEPEAPKMASGFAGINVKASINDVKKVWERFRQHDSLDPDQDDISAAQTALCCSHFLSTWGQVY